MKFRKRWWEYTFEDFLRYRRWKKWKQKAFNSIAENLTAKCVACDDLIFPGDLVGTPRPENRDETNKLLLIHAGFHDTLQNDEPAFCVTGAIACGIWNGKWVEKYKGLQEPLALKAIRTGQVQSGTY